MKKNLYYGLMACMMGFAPLNAVAQSDSTIVLERGDSLVLNAPDGYHSYRWHVSSDNKHFYKLNNEQRLATKVYAPGYYRMQLIDDNYKSKYDTIEVNMKKVNYPATIKMGAGHGYVVRDGVPVRGGISIPEEKRNSDGAVNSMASATNWNDKTCSAVYFIHHSKNTVDTDLLINAKGQVALKVSIFDPAKMDEPLAQNIVAFEGKGKLDTLRVICAELPKTSYYRYEIECLKGNDNIKEISGFIHRCTSYASKKQTYKPGYLNSPSVHLSQWRCSDTKAPKGRSYDWCYQEVMMPKDADIPNTYIMSLGVLDGYMGIQMNGWNGKTPKHDVIFSMWDHGSTDNDPNLPENLRANVVDHGPGVHTERFANEGTGMKSFKAGNNWNCDTFVQFITNCRPEVATYTITNKEGKQEQITQKNTLVSAWFNAQDGKGWQYMATLRLANKSIKFDSWYSFLENFYTYPDGMFLRKGFYRNGYGYSDSKKQWYHFNTVNLGNTDGGTKIGARDDFGHGIWDADESAYFMTTGSYIPKNSPGGSLSVPLNKANTAVDSINLQKLLERVDLAVKNEKAKIEAKENFEKNKIAKADWKVLDFSSEEKEGEANGEMGLASQIIDNDYATYWHSKWKGGNAQYPHSFVVDMAEFHDINGVQITSSNSSGATRTIKAYDFYLSEDNNTWEKVHSETNSPNETTIQVMLPASVKARYFKLVINDGHASEGPFVRVNEIDLTEGKATGIEAAQASQFQVSAGNGEVLVKVPAALTNAEISVFRADGACVATESYSALAAGEMVRLPMATAAKGVYVVTCKADQFNAAKQIMWNK